MIATYGGIGTAKVVQVLDFPAGIVGVNGVMRFLVLEEPMSVDGRQQFIPPLTPVTIMRQLGANIRLKDGGDVLEIEDDQRNDDPHGEVGQRTIWTCAQPAGLLFERRMETARQLARSAQV